jgi:hypothetical protein
MRRSQQHFGASAAGHWRRRARLVAATLGLTLGVSGAGVALTAMPVYANVTTGDYTIGTPSGAVGGVVATPSSAAEATLVDFEVTFTSGAALSAGSDSWINVIPSTELGSAPTGIDLVGSSSPPCFQSGTTGEAGPGTAAVTGITIELGSNCAISAGEGVQIDFTAVAPTSPVTLTFSITTSSNGTPATSNGITVNSSVVTLAAQTLGYGANTTYTISNVPVANLGAENNQLTLTADIVTGSEAITFYDGATGYSVTYTPLDGTATADVVEAASVSGNTVTLTLGTGLATGDTLYITATGTNPGSNGLTDTDNITVTPGTGSPEPTNSLTFGNSVSAVAVSPSVLSASASATYVVSFIASDAVPAGEDIFLRETNGPTNFSSVSGVLVDDSSRPWQFVAAGVSLSDGSVVIPLQDAIDSGDAISVTLTNVINPPAGTITDFSVSTSSDGVLANAAPYAIGGSASTGALVTVTPSAAGAVATYTISDLQATASMTGGSGTITLDGPAETAFPGSGAYYTLEDSTTPSGSGTVTAAVSGGGTNDVTLTVPNTINYGDHLSLIIQDVLNPATASAADSITLVGNVSASSSAALAPTFPQANVSYPNGAIVSFSGTDYVFAGGHAFAVGSSSALTALQKVDHATVVTAPAGAAVPTAAPRTGTLVFTRPVTGIKTIYVVGTDGDLHGFATPAQFLGDGYDAALVVTVTSVSGLTVGATAGSEGASANALATTADGAIVVSSGAYYVFAGGKAIGVPNPTSLTTIMKADKAKALSGTVTSAQTGASVANGVLLSAAGVVYVSFQGDLWPFGSLAQLAADGYSGTAALTAPGTSGITVVFSYSGS